MHGSGQTPLDNSEQVARLPEGVGETPPPEDFKGTIYFNLVKLFNIKNKEMNNKEVILDIQLLENSSPLKSIQSRQYHLRQEDYDLTLHEVHSMLVHINRTLLQQYKLQASLRILDDPSSLTFEMDLAEILQNP